MTLTVGIVGYGDIAQYHRRHLLAAGVRVVAAVTSRQVAPGMVSYGSLRDMLPHVDAVTVAVPNNLHGRYAVEVLKAGKPVFVEKPLCLTEEELRQIEHALGSAMAPLQVGFRLRWNPHLLTVRERVEGVRSVRCIYRLGLDRLADGKPWTRRRAESGGAFFTLGVHALHLARWIADAGADPLRDLVARERHVNTGADFPLSAELEGTTRQGVRVVAGADLCGDAAFELELVVDADKGAYPDASPSALALEDRTAADIEYAGMMAAFVDAARTCERDPESEAEILQVHRELIEAQRIAALESSS